MKNRILNIIFFFLYGTACFCQSVYFNNRYEGIVGWWDFGMSIIETDTSYILGGGTRWVYTYDDRIAFWNIDKTGNLNFIQNYGDTSWRFPSIFGGSLIKTKENGFVQVGQTSDYFGKNKHGYLFKLNSQLDSSWFVKIYDDTTFSSYLSQAIELPDSGFVAAGVHAQNNWQMLLLRTDKNGNILWEKKYGGSQSEAAYNIAITKDGDYILGGYTTSFGAGWSDDYIVKTDSEGNFQWQRTFGTIEYEGGAAVAAAANGDILAGNTEFKYKDSTNALNKQAYIARLDKDNNLLWKKNYGKITSPGTSFSRIKELQDSTIVAIGHIDEPDTLPTNNITGMMVKTDAAGNQIWLREYFKHEDLPSDNYFWDFIPTSDGGFAIAGHILVVTSSNPLTYYQDAWVLKLDSLGCPYPGCDTVTGVIEIAPFLSYGEIVKVFPNPAREQITVTGYYSLPATMKIYDIAGKIVFQKQISSHYEYISIEKLPVGMYVYEISAAKGVQRGKLIIEK